MNQLTKPKRPRIVQGQLVASTNKVKLGCIKALHIAHFYNPINYSRIRQTVI